MDAVELLKEAWRMCKEQSDCKLCPISEFCPIGNYVFKVEEPEKAVEIVEKWAEEHPKKTRVSEFLKMFPNAQLQPDGMLNFDLKPCDIDPEYADKVCDQYSSCPDCCKAYWLEEE